MCPERHVKDRRHSFQGSQPCTKFPPESLLRLLPLGATRWPQCVLVTVNISLKSLKAFASFCNPS